MPNFALDGLWLLGALGVVYLAGVFTSQWVKDKIKGVPSDLRAALKTTEAASLAEVTSARDKVVAETATLLSRGKAVVAAAAPAALAAPAVPAAPVPVSTGPAV